MSGTKLKRDHLTPEQLGKEYDKIEEKADESSRQNEDMFHNTCGGWLLNFIDLIVIPTITTYHDEFSHNGLLSQ